MVAGLGAEEVKLVTRGDLAWIHEIWDALYGVYMGIDGHGIDGRQDRGASMMSCTYSARRGGNKLDQTVSTVQVSHEMFKCCDLTAGIVCSIAVANMMFNLVCLLFLLPTYIMGPCENNTRGKLDFEVRGRLGGDGAGLRSLIGAG